MSKKPANEEKPKLIIRNATAADVPAIRELCGRVYVDMKPHGPDQLRGQILNFPEGQFVAVYQDAIVGYCATFRIKEALGLAPHTWSQITGAGYASRHDPDGDWLYGMEVFVDPERRGLRIGQRLYTARKTLAVQLKLKGIVFGGRIPGLARKWKSFDSAEAYVEAVAERRLRDTVLTFQLRNGFEVMGVLRDYLPSDRQSMGYAAHLIWRNSKYVEVAPLTGRQRGRVADSVRVAAIQYQQRRVSSFESFAQ
jgi:GNAT superfamily N-acetyltransferase